MKHSKQDVDIYSKSFVRELFDEMSKSYGIVNTFSSFGFCHIWRMQCLRQIEFSEGMVIQDWMSGMGEYWTQIAKKMHGTGSLTAIDFSEEMKRLSSHNQKRLNDISFTYRLEDILDNSLEPHSADCIISCFGLKTFSQEQLNTLVKNIQTVLRPGGTFCFLEISVPPSLWLRIPYMFYLKYIIPWMGRIFLGNPDNYRMLGLYTERFGSVEATVEQMRHVGLKAEKKSFFFGCATAAVGGKEE